MPKGFKFDQFRNMSRLAGVVHKEHDQSKTEYGQSKTNNSSITVTTTDSDSDSDNNQLIDMLKEHVPYSSTQNNKTLEIKEIEDNDINSDATSNQGVNEFTKFDQLSFNKIGDELCLQYPDT